MRNALFFRIIAVICAFVFSTSITLAQTKTVSGVVSDEGGKPLEGATVSQKGGTAMTSTDQNGNFRLDVASSATTLVISYVGMENVEVAVGTKTSFRITLRSTDSKLGEVVVVGYGKARRANLTS